MTIKTKTMLEAIDQHSMEAIVALAKILRIKDIEKLPEYETIEKCVGISIGEIEVRIRTVLDEEKE